MTISICSGKYKDSKNVKIKFYWLGEGPRNWQKSNTNVHFLSVPAARSLYYYAFECEWEQWQQSVASSYTQDGVREQWRMTCAVPRISLRKRGSFSFVKKFICKDLPWFVLRESSMNISGLNHHRRMKRGAGGQKKRNTKKNSKFGKNS